MIALAGLGLLTLLTLAAPWFNANWSGMNAYEQNLDGTIMIDGKETYVVSPDGTPLGPGLHGQFLLGADQNGRDVMVRMLYGGRTSIFVGVGTSG